MVEILDHVRRCFPNCLDSDILLINCFWELLRQWSNQPLIHTIEMALEYLEKVSSSVLKHNVASMAWRLFIQKRFEILCNLIEKMGKKPKDRVIKKELGMGNIIKSEFFLSKINVCLFVYTDENNLEEFSNFSCDLVDFMIRTSASSETEALPLYTMDDWWNSFNSLQSYNTNYNEEFIKYDLQTTTGNKSKQPKQPSLLNESSSLYSLNIPLAVMAMHQKMANIDLLIEYYHLAQCIQFIIIFSVRNVRPLSLFPSSIRAYFFKDLVSFLSIDTTNDGIILNDPEITEIRRKFLTNTITSIVQTIPSYRNGMIFFIYIFFL